jgi:hypothetical protein
MVSENFGNGDVTLWYQRCLLMKMLHCGIGATVLTLSLHGSSFYIKKKLD